MNFRRDFEIAFVGLKPGVHHFDFDIDNKFFTHYGQQDFTNCKATVKLELDKQNGFMLLKFDIDGWVDVACDRCGNPLPLQLWEEFKVMVKLVDNPEEMNDQEEDPDVYYISRSESHVDVANWIYEFINLSIPMQKICSYEKMDGPHCNPAALDVLKKMGTTDESGTNPIWKGLEKFKDLDN